MEIKYKVIDQKDIEWASVLSYFNVTQSDDKLCIKQGMFSTLMVFCWIDKKNDTIVLRSYGRHLLTTQIASHYERLFGVKVEVEMRKDELYSKLCDIGFC